MRSALAFITICACWSISWFCIKLQVTSHVPITISIFYRMMGASLLLLLILFLSRDRFSPTLSELKILIFAGMLSALNFFLVYTASGYIPSGMVATLSATTIFVGEAINCLYKKTRPNLTIIVTGVTGAIGIFVMLQNKIFASRLDLDSFVLGILLCLFANVALSIIYVTFANVFSDKTSSLMIVGYMSFFGSIFVLLAGLCCGGSIEMDYSVQYIASLLYLTVFASAAAYSALYYLNRTIGPAKSGYTSLVYTPFSLFISTTFEGLKWHTTSTIGIIIIFISLIIGLLSKEQKLSRGSATKKQ